jgi:glutamate carboxypeptidase
MSDISATDIIPPRWLKLLKTVVEINSGTPNIQGQEKVRDAFIPEFEALGLKASVFPLADGRKVVSLQFPGAKPDLLLVGHIDTVFPETSSFQKFSSTGAIAAGPGVIDMKGGNVLLLNALSDMRDEDLLKRVRVVLNDDEEIGSVYSQNKLLELAQGVRSGLVFEPGLSDGALVTAQAGIRWLELIVHGKAAHAGLEPENGINAAAELAHKLTQIHALTDYSCHLTVNIGSVGGGTATNIVCQEASANLDIRYVDQADLDRVLAKIQAIAQSSSIKSRATGDKPTAEIKEISRRPDMPVGATAALFKMAQSAGAAVHQEIKGRAVGYASDANGLAKTGMNLLVGLGPYGGGMHTDKEYMVQRSYPERLQLVTMLMRNILQAR